MPNTTVTAMKRVMAQESDLAAVVSNAAQDIGSFIRTQREAAEVSIRQLAEALASAGAVGSAPGAPDERFKRPEILISRRGGHNGFHGRGDSPRGCWGDRLTVRWIQALLASGKVP